MASHPESAWVVPELGPSLGQLVAPTGVARGALRLAFDDIRTDLVTGVFDLAGAGRSFGAAGDRDGAVASLGRVAWLGLWERAVAAAAARVAAEANTGLQLAAEESRYPPRRLARLLLTDEDTRAVAARLGSGGGPFVAALDAMEQTANVTAGARGKDLAGARSWQAAVAAAARRLEAAWLALEAASRAEQDRWAAEIAQVRDWRRPGWPVWTMTAVLLGIAVYLGLVLGGYVPVPPPLRGLATVVWSWL